MGRPPPAIRIPHRVGPASRTRLVAPYASIGRWARRPIETGQPGCPFVPLVLGPEGVPRVTDPDVARRAPELAVLSVQAHGREEGALELAVAALQGAVGRDADACL